MKKTLLQLFLLVVVSTTALWAQKDISGSITDVDGALIGATVMVEGTSLGTVTDFDGKFALTVPENATYLLFSYTGYGSQRMEIGGTDIFEVRLEDSGVDLGEVVVTALGVKREKKAIGYAVQDVKAEEIAETRSTNVVNGLVR